MTWSEPLELRIFVHKDHWKNTWLEQLLGTVIKPIYLKFGESIKWMWITRYVQSIEDALSKTSAEYAAENPSFIGYFNYASEKQTDMVVYAIFRICVDETLKQQIQDNVISLTKEKNYYTLLWVLMIF